MFSLKYLSGRQTSWIIVLSFIIAGALLVPQLAVQSLTNWGDLLLLHGVMQNANNVERYSLWNLSNNHQGEKAHQIFSIIPRFVLPDRNWEWRMGRAALIKGDAADAIRVLTVNRALSKPFNPIRFLDTIEAHSRAGYDTEVITLYTNYQAHPFLTGERLISDTVALSYLNQAQTQLNTGQSELARSSFRQALNLRPFDLYINYWLGRNSLPFDKETQLYFDRFYHFTLAAIKPEPDERFLEHFFSAFPDPMEHDQWGEARTINLISYWVWQYPNWPALGKLLDLLTERFPMRSVWPHLQGERYQRLGKRDLAVFYYRMALARQPEDKLAEVQLARLFDDNIEYYTGSVPDQELVSQILGIPRQAVEISANLGSTITVSIDSLNVVGGQTNWPFVGGLDPLASSSSLRISNLWWPATDQILGFTPYAEYHSENFLVDEAWIMISILFRVNGNSNHFGFLGIGNSDSANWQPYITNTNFMDTSGYWRRAVIISRVPLPSSHWFVLLRNWGAASVWFDQLTVRTVKLSDTPKYCTQEPCIYFQPIILK